MLNKKIPLYILILSLLVFIVVFSVAFSTIEKSKAETQVFVPVDNVPACSYRVHRLEGYEYIRPLMFADPICESDHLSLVKADIENIINTHKNAGTIESASVYLRLFTKGDWILAGDDNKYSPGSLLKIPMLITYCKMKERDPKLFDKKITYNHVQSESKTIHFTSKSIEPGHSYTIRELLRYMISYSDNNATNLLTKNADPAIFKKIFQDIGLKMPDWKGTDYPISSTDYSIFLRLLYNASYLTIEDSEFCTELLSTCDFKEGMISGLPENCKVAHKFGEGGLDTSPCFSESGIIYLGNNAYILTVMTKGRDIKKLPKVIGEISKQVYYDVASSNFFQGI